MRTDDWLDRIAAHCSAVERQQEAATAAGDDAAMVAAIKNQRAAARKIGIEQARARGAGLLSAGAVQTLQDCARMRRLAAAAGWVGLSVEGGRIVYDAPKDDGEGKRVAVGMAPLGALRVDIGRKRLDRLARKSTFAIGEGWHTDQAAIAANSLRAAKAEETRAVASRLLRLGLPGRAAARAARIAAGAGRRWLRRNSRREALALFEVGAAAGVDDLGAGADWGRELMAIAGTVHQRAAVYGAAIVAAPLPPCAALVARGLSGGETISLRRAVLGRGRRIDGAAVVEWHSVKGRQVREDSIGLIGRGIAWIWAAKQSGREMHSARYGMSGRDGREVAADFKILGNVAARGPLVPTRRPSMVAAIRDQLALDVWSARRAVAVARRDAFAAVSPLERMTAGSALGSARNALQTAIKRARLLGRAMRGLDLDAHDLAAFVERGERLTNAGKLLAKRLRKSIAARLPVSVPVKRPVAASASLLMGDELASAR